MSSKQRVKVVVCGRVQGVGFRYFTLHAAQNRGLVGFVKNETDGSVVVEAEGTMTAIYSLLHDLGRGPRLASVSSIDVQKIECLDQEQEFKIRSW